MLDQINSAIQDTGYVLVKFDLNPDVFGNVVVELSRDGHTTRIVHDRGDVYLDRRENDSELWTEPQLVFTHLETVGDSYNTLINTVEHVVRRRLE